MQSTKPRKAFCVAFFLLSSSLFFLPCANSSENPPNIIVILFDDLGFHDVGYNGSEIKTPNIDALARVSIVLDQFYVFPWCSSTRAAVETGINPAAFGMRSLEHNFPQGSALPRGVRTLPERLAERGYFNAFLGKWHLSLDFSNGPLKKGYHKAFGYLSGQLDHILHDDQFGKSVLFEGERFIHRRGHMTDLIYQEVSNIITSRVQPFYINISFSAPHYPVQSLPEYEQINRHIENRDRRAYAGMVTHMDDVIGKMVDQLRQVDELDNTYIFMFSDNGGQKNWANERYYGGRFLGRNVMAVNSPLRGFKSSLYEGGIRVPFLVFDPKVKKGVRSNEFATALDVVATVIDLAGGRAEFKREGVNLIEMVRDQKARKADFYWQTTADSFSLRPGGGFQEAVREGDFKLVRSQRRYSWFPFRWRWPWDRYELFDLSKDIQEKHDLSEERPDLVRALSRKLAARSEAYQASFARYSE